MEFKDYYQVLGVDKGAETEVIKRAYKKLARKYHPDVSKEPDAEKRMQEINEAWTVLSDPEKKEAYDNLGSRYHSGDQFQAPPGWDNFHFSQGGQNFNSAEFSDFFSSIFGGGFGASGAGAEYAHHARSRARSSHGEDITVNLEIDLEDSLKGAKRQISLNTPTGPRVLQISIPSGVTEGQKIRLNGQGQPSMGGGKSGDLYLEVHFRPHTNYRLEGKNIYGKLLVAPWELALGAEIVSKTSLGEFSVKIPANTPNGRQLRLRERGLPGKPAGDLILQLEVVLPICDNDKARHIYQQMQQELDFNPR